MDFGYILIFLGISILSSMNGKNIGDNYERFNKILL